RALARRLGLTGPDGELEFWRRHAAHTGVVETAFAALFHGAEKERRRDERPELATLLESLDQQELALWQLGQLGFSDLEGAYRDLRLMGEGPSLAPRLATPRQELVRA